jgi:hypothetical protein
MRGAKLTEHKADYLLPPTHPLASLRTNFQHLHFPPPHTYSWRVMHKVTFTCGRKGSFLPKALHKGHIFICWKRCERTIESKTIDNRLLQDNGHIFREKAQVQGSEQTLIVPTTPDWSVLRSHLSLAVQISSLELLRYLRNVQSNLMPNW